MNSRVTLGQKIKEARLMLSMTQKDLAGTFITTSMLSQIEHDLATPSIKTLEYIAQAVHKPISYFVDTNERNYDITLIETLMHDYDNGQYLECIKTIEVYFETHPKAKTKSLIRNIYLNCCIKVAMHYKEDSDFEHAKEVYEKMLAYENELIFEADTVLYSVYTQLAEVNKHVDSKETSKVYANKAIEVVNKLASSRMLQNIYGAFVESSYDEVISYVDSVNVDELDAYNKGRYNMMIGSAYYYKEEYENAIQYLKLAIGFYEQQTYNSVLAMIYEEISKCYIHMDQHQQAQHYLNLAQLQIEHGDHI